MPPYATSPAKGEIINKQIDLWLSQEVIKEGKSPWGAPVIIILQNGKPRLCIDWRHLNAATVADQHLISRQTDILQVLTGAQYLSIFDALSGFTQMEFDKESHPITAIRTHRGLHQENAFWMEEWAPRIPASYARDPGTLLMDICSSIH